MRELKEQNSIDLQAQAVERAVEAARNAYCRYSKFPVGAAVIGEDGQIYAGCNVENISFGLTCCAERNAIFQAIAAGNRAIRTVVVYTPTKSFTTPCGACRQVIGEFGINAKVICVNQDREVFNTSGKELLPAAFESAELSGSG